MYRLMGSVSLFQETNILVDSGARKMEIFTLKAHTKAFLFALVIASMYAFAYAVKGILWFFSVWHNELFSQIEQKRVGLPRSRTRPKTVLLLSMICCMRDLRGSCSFPKPSLTRSTGPQCSTSLEVWKADPSLAIRQRIPLSQSKQARTWDNNSINNLLTLSRWVYWSFLISHASFRPAFISYIFCFRDFSAKRRWKGWWKP